MEQSKHDVTQHLIEAGWHVGRVFDFSEYAQALIEDGYDISEKVTECLRSYGGLTIRHSHPKSPDHIDTLHFDAKEAAQGIYPARVDDYVRRTGKSLCPIGEAYTSHMTLLMAPDGSVYAGYDHILLAFGDSILEAVFSIIYKKDEDHSIPE